jgi:hypothetical protein
VKVIIASGRPLGFGYRLSLHSNHLNTSGVARDMTNIRPTGTADILKSLAMGLDHQPSF